MKYTIYHICEPNQASLWIHVHITNQYDHTISFFFKVTKYKLYLDLVLSPEDGITVLRLYNSAIKGVYSINVYVPLVK